MNDTAWELTKFYLTISAGITALAFVIVWVDRDVVGWRNQVIVPILIGFGWPVWALIGGIVLPLGDVRVDVHQARMLVRSQEEPSFWTALRRTRWRHGRRFFT